MKDYILDLVIHLMRNPYETSDSTCQFKSFVTSNPVNIIRDVYDRTKSEFDNSPNSDSEFVLCNLMSAITDQIRSDSRLGRDLMVKFPEVINKNYRIRNSLPITVIRDTVIGAIRYEDPSGNLPSDKIVKFSKDFHLFMLLDELVKVMPYSQAKEIQGEFVRHPGFLNADTIDDSYEFEKGWELIAKAVGQPFVVWIPKALFD